jgi:hypothetical protein
VNGLCPECGNPPQYHSFCSICCKLFTGGGARWRTVCNRMMKAGESRAAAEAIAQRKRAAREIILAKVRVLRDRDVEAADAEAALGMLPGQLRVYCTLAGLPPFRRPPRDANKLPNKPPCPKRPVWSPERLALLKRVLGIDGTTYDAAAAALDTSRGAIAGAVRDHFPELFGRRKRPIRVRAITEARP